MNNPPNLRISGSLPEENIVMAKIIRHFCSMLLHWIWNHLEASWYLCDHCAMGSRKTLLEQGGWTRSPHWWSLPALTLLWLYHFLPVDKETKLQMGELARWSTAVVAGFLVKVVEESTISNCVCCGLFQISIKFTLKSFLATFWKVCKKDQKMNAYQNHGGGCLSVRGAANRNRRDLAFVLLLWLLFHWDTEIGHWAWWKCKWRGGSELLVPKMSMYWKGWMWVRKIKTV